VKGNLMGETIFGVVIFLVLVAATPWARQAEKKRFNGGFCGCGR